MSRRYDNKVGEYFKVVDRDGKRTVFAYGGDRIIKLNLGRDKRSLISDFVLESIVVALNGKHYGLKRNVHGNYESVWYGGRFFIGKDHSRKQNIVAVCDGNANYIADIFLNDVKTVMENYSE